MMVCIHLRTWILFENESKELEVEYDYEIEKEDGRYVVKSDGASITIYASTLSKFNLDCTLRHAEEKLRTENQ